ncbi:aprataxin-like protein [Conoideocrella luteorostrata]|uniref:Aprataxin-like protein n=1 Tax=Conoideocrella luteorostrata TaxID=1105319 RepID=A0AAJ0CCP8_9HYPO|nr:aprataxin-like protein [Conoideocrella luteorostrata]
MESDPDEALTQDEIQGKPTAPPPPQNAFTALMAPKPKPPPKPSASIPRMSHPNPFKDRMGLGAYIADPASFPPSTIIYQNDDFVAIHDKYPKSTVHTLLLPRSPEHNLLHPYEAFKDVDFLRKVQAEVGKLRVLVAGELQRRLGQYSAAESDRQAVLNGERELEGGDSLPTGRDWEAEVISGVHAVPSMSHLHVHVLSRDMHSGSLRHRKHYNSFSTGFLVDVMDFPLEEGDGRLDPKGEAFLRRDLKCWRCGTAFGNKFTKLKEHLEEEFVSWRRE